MSALFSSCRLGDIHLPNRIVMAPMSRARAGVGETATRLMAEYYRQRASAGLLIGESAQISRQGQGFAWAPGLHSAAQIVGWRGVTDAVHAAGGRIFAQLWHAGRMSHVSLQPDGAAPVAPSALPVPTGRVFVDPLGAGAASRAGEWALASPARELSVGEIDDIVTDFAAAARNAIEAGFDGVELHGAHGYLLQQFLDPTINRRDDRYGGSIAGRLRFVCETAKAVVAAVGAGRVGLRVAPYWSATHTCDCASREVALMLAAQMQKIGLGYLHICEPDHAEMMPLSASFRRAMRETYRGTLIYTGGYDAMRAEAAVREGWTDLVGFGRAFIANPDLPHRLRLGVPLNDGDRSTFFGGAAEGYIDYPMAGPLGTRIESDVLATSTEQV